MDSLQELLLKRNDSLSLVLGYGDSNDGTEKALLDETQGRLSASLHDVSHGGPHFGSIVHPERFRQLAFVYNSLWEKIPESSDVVGLVESDLIWRADQLMLLIDKMEYDVVLSPLVLHLDERFYDTYAFRMDGINFKNEKPYHPNLIQPEVSSRRYYLMDSVGSVVFMKYSLAKQLTWPEEDVIVGLCRQITQKSSSYISLDSFAKVYHP